MRRIAFTLALALGLSPVGAFPGSYQPKGYSAPNAPAPPQEPVETSPARRIDRLYQRLAKTRYPDEAAGILGEIDRERAQSGSDAADLLYGRAQKARASANLPLALQLYDAVLALDPAWSEAWSARATARFQSGDLKGAMADLAQTLKREPRDVGALAGLGAILLDSGEPEAALRAYDRALALAPALAPLQEARARAQTQAWSRAP
ncbi:MAG: tetratricopeptide repeat protein [Pseudomonadota bacterium]|nr:tetratricopeptide repeat protein [Pseudomonadota bacterium]